MSASAQATHVRLSTTQLTAVQVSQPDKRHAAQAFQFDPVKIEIERFAYLAPETLKAYITSDGMLNHFQMFWELRDQFPLHFIVFKQVSSHIPHEANVEQYFSRAVSARASRTAHPCRRVSHSRCGISSCSLPPCGVQGLLSDPNMDPEYLAMLVTVGRWV